MELLDRLSDQAEAVMLNEWNKETKKREYLETIPTEQFSLDYVRKHWGPGTYVALLLNERNRAVGTRAFTIGAKRKEGEALPNDAATPVAARPGMDPQVIVLNMQIEALKAFAQSQGEMMKGLFTMLAPQKDGEKKPAFTPPDPIAMIEKLASTMKALTPEAPAQAPGVFDAKTMGEMFREGLEVGKMAANPDEGFGKIAETLVPKVVDVLDAASRKEGLKTRGTEPRLKPGAAPAAPAQEPQVNIHAAPWLAHLRPFVREIAAWAQAGYDPEAYAISLAARLPDNVIDEIELASRDPQFVEKAIGALPPQFQAYRAWLTAALEALKEQVQPEPTEPGSDDDDGDAGGGGQ
jgi:hypothetical protein